MLGQFLIWLILLYLFVKFIRYFRKPNYHIFGLYSTGGEFFRVKRYILFVLLWLRKWKERGLSTPPMYNKEDIVKAEECDREQELADDPKAIDSVFFNGDDPTSGLSFIIRFARRPDRSAEFWLLLRLPDGRILVQPQYPNTRLLNTNGKTWAAEGCRIVPQAANERWKVIYCGFMKLRDSDDKEEEMVHINLHAQFRAYTNTFDVETDMSSLLTAEGVARETWSSKFFEDLKTHDRQKHIEQWGAYTGSLTVNKKDTMKLNLRGYRDHSYGLRDWTKYHRYAAHFGHLENGATFSIGSVCMPGSLSHLRYGYYFTPYGAKHPVTWHNMNLWTVGELGPPPLSYSFKFQAGGETFSVTVSAEHAAKLNVGLRREAIIFDRFTKFRINGHKGVGVTEFCYRNPIELPEDERKSLAPLDQQSFISDETTLLCVPFASVACCNPALVGGKGAQLGQLSTIGDKINVPGGFVVSTTAYKRFLKVNRPVVKKIKRLVQISSGSQPGDIQIACEEVVNILKESKCGQDIEDAILSTAFDTVDDAWRQKRLAVRSSAANEDGSEASGAGQMQTFLGVQGEEELLKHVMHCWASQFSYQAVEYRRQHGLPIDCAMGVVVQEMVPAEVAGVLFTSDPLNGDAATVTINANYGLGESVVSGECEPDTFTLTRYPDERLELRDTSTGSKKIRVILNDEAGTTTQSVDEEDVSASLVEDQVQELGKLGILIEKHYGSPRDIEWAIAGGNIYVLQARPITTTDIESDDELLHEFDSALSYDKEYVTSANIGEMMPLAVTPLTWSVFGGCINRVLQGTAVTMSILPEYVTARRFLPNVTNHLFINLQCLALNSELHQMSGNKDMVWLALMGRILKDPDLNALEYFVGKSGFFTRCKNAIITILYRNRSTDTTKVWEKRLRDGYHIRKLFSAREQFLEIDNRMEDYCKCWSDTVLNTSKSAVWSMVLMNILAGGNWTNEVFSQVALLLSTCENVYSADVPSALEEFAETLAKSEDLSDFKEMSDDEQVDWLMSQESGKAGQVFRQFLHRHGHRCVREAEFREKSWRTEPHQVISVVMSMIEADVYKRPPKTVLSPEEAISQLTVPLNSVKKWFVTKIVPKARQGVALREWGKSLSIEMVDAFKEGYIRLGDLMTREGRLCDPDLVFFFTQEELRMMFAERDRRYPGLVAKAHRRRRILETQKAFVYPEIECGIPNAEIETDDSQVHGSEVELSGMPVSQGVLMAKARVISTLKEAANIKKGELLIVPYTDVGWTPYFPLIGGLVTEKGGLLSHGAVVAREYGLPCIVGCRRATSVFATGDLVRLNATQGVIEKIEET